MRYPELIFVTIICLIVVAVGWAIGGWTGIVIMALGGFWLWDSWHSYY